MNREQFIRILCLALGFRTAIKNVHWNYTDKGNKHKVLDDFVNDFDDFTDAFAEDGTMVFGKVELHEINEIPISYTDGIDLASKCNRFAKACKRTVLKGDEVELAGLNNICDDFVHKMQINMYRFQMD
jgi:hypothetical protein